MSNAPARTRPPLVLVANAHEWSSRALESILQPAGYAVLKAYSGRDALEGAHGARLDAIVLDTELPDADALTLCRALRVDPDISPSTPIFLTTPGPSLRGDLLAALRAGANALWGQPFDTEQFLLRLEGHLRAKLDADRAREHGLFDERTGLYNATALERRVRELAAQAERSGTALTCVAAACRTPSAGRARASSRCSPRRPAPPAPSGWASGWRARSGISLARRESRRSGYAPATRQRWARAADQPSRVKWSHGRSLRCGRRRPTLAAAGSDPSPADSRRPR